MENDYLAYLHLYMWPILLLFLFFMYPKFHQDTEFFQKTYCSKCWMMNQAFTLYLVFLHKVRNPKCNLFWGCVTVVVLSNYKLCLTLQHYDLLYCISFCALTNHNFYAMSPYKIFNNICRRVQVHKNYEGGQIWSALCIDGRQDIACTALCHNARKNEVFKSKKFICDAVYDGVTFYIIEISRKI